MNSYLEYLCSKLIVRWFGANHYEVKPKYEDDDFEATLKEMQEGGWRLIRKSEHSALLSFGGEMAEVPRSG